MAKGPLPTYRDRVQAEWIDYNGHMSEAYYVLVFGFATDALYDHIGLDAMARGRTGTSVYTLEAHVSYLAEVAEGAQLEVHTRVLDHDAKRVHIFHEMHDGKDGKLVATEELMLLYVDMEGPRATPFPDEVVELLHALQEAQATLPRPAQAGRAIGLKR